MAIITISREMGTGAYQIAKEVAKKLKYTLVDGPKIAEMAPQYGLSDETLERVDEKLPAYRTAEDRQQAAYLNIIELILLDFARAGNVILYGRGGQDLLIGMTNVLRLRIIAPFEERVERFAEREWIDPDLARELIRKSDIQRGGFIRYYFDRDWQDPLGYDLTINSSLLGKGTTVDMIVAAARDPRLKEREDESMKQLENMVLRKKVETELLMSGDIESLPLKLAVKKGVVSLIGHVYSDEERQKAVAIVENVAGVKKVVDSMQVVSYKRYKE